MIRVLYELRGGAAHITLSDPDRGNALDAVVVDELHTAVRRARMDDVGVLVLRGAGHAFCVGGDVRAFHDAEDVDHTVENLAEALHRTISELHRMNAVVVTVVQGTAAGAGVALAAAGDLVLAGASARFTLAYTRLGLSPDGAAAC
ncbi:enoyl-CoA hydratase/isomerase family protein [Nocardioides KLBMP 9356]|uniref:Enoyl-CoA hydratase/isomerase family protein n=1 Tax=Nocardioides potassii TaxID=2911371 RepID=A0ABS9H7R1_9ACTN|nr:enoyl-CoA hydratase/isomerase family protein [Nocardioides potassii]MCF6376348.1 enoyl-CoA hydratase/isomerase family protein [Nocardioides potassii]